MVVASHQFSFYGMHERAYKPLSVCDLIAIRKRWPYRLVVFNLLISAPSNTLEQTSRGGSFCYVVPKLWNKMQTDILNVINCLNFT